MGFDRSFSSDPPTLLGFRSNGFFRSCSLAWVSLRLDRLISHVFRAQTCAPCPRIYREGERAHTKYVTWRETEADSNQPPIRERDHLSSRGIPHLRSHPTIASKLSSRPHDLQVHLPNDPSKLCQVILKKNSVRLLRCLSTTRLFPLPPSLLWSDDLPPSSSSDASSVACGRCARAAALPLPPRVRTGPAVRGGGGGQRQGRSIRTAMSQLLQLGPEGVVMRTRSMRWLDLGPKNSVL